MFDFFKKRPQQKPDMSPSKWVQGVVWISRAITYLPDGSMVEQPVSGKEAVINQQKRTGVESNVGHASVRTSEPKGIYASHWPEIQGGMMAMVKTGVRAYPRRTFEQDKRAEGGSEPKIITLYSLNRELIHEEYMRLQKILWSLKGDKVVIAHTENCSSFAYKLLKAGGINELSPSCSALDSFFRTKPLEPGDILKCLLDAKKRELDLYPETAEYDKSKSDTNSPGNSI